MLTGEADKQRTAESGGVEPEVRGSEQTGDPRAGKGGVKCDAQNRGAREGLCVMDLLAPVPAPRRQSSGS